MKLTALNQLIFKKMKESREPARVFAARAQMSYEKFLEKSKNQDFSWEEIKRMHLPLQMSEFCEAIERDFLDGN